MEFTNSSIDAAVDRYWHIRQIMFASSIAKVKNATRFPKTLRGFGYDINDEGQLRQIDPLTGRLGDKPFEFNYYSEHSENQKRYDALGDTLTQYIYQVLEEDLELLKMPLPRNGPPYRSSFVYISRDFFLNSSKLLVLVHGSGVVRAGQWARRLMINHSLDAGTQLPFIKKAMSMGYAVLVANTNDNTRLIDNRKVEIMGSRTPEEHLYTIWTNYIQPLKVKKIAVVAHSYGGVGLVDLASKEPLTFKDKVFAIAFTDSVHSFQIQEISPEMKNLLKEISRNWVSSEKSLDTPLPYRDDIPKVSAGTKEHAMTSWASFESIFTFLEEKYAASMEHNP